MLRAGRSARSVAAELQLSHAALLRHARNHLRRDAPLPIPITGDNGAVLDDPLDELVAALRLRALAGNPSDTREYRLALAAQVAARHATAPTQAVADTAEWIALRTLLLQALDPFPAARLAVATAIERVGA
jgi:hypothetical protein